MEKQSNIPQAPYVHMRVSASTFSVLGKEQDLTPVFLAEKQEQGKAETQNNSLPSGKKP
ncbi:MAG: hypothetical protein J6K61_07035 [Clostridia bacterium]|jgi:hypothetical protein|nr:hypothetical protein [Clostridia bacterium]